MEIDYEKQYNEEAQTFIKIVEVYNGIQENDIAGAFRLMKESLQAYNRWSKIKHDIKKISSRGVNVATRERLEEMCKYLIEVYTCSRMIWKSSREDYRNNREGM